MTIFKSENSAHYSVRLLVRRKKLWWTIELKYTKINEPDPGYWAQGEFLTFSVKVYRLKVAIMEQYWIQEHPFVEKENHPKQKSVYFFLFICGY